MKGPLTKKSITLKQKKPTSHFLALIKKDTLGGYGKETANTMPLWSLVLKEEEETDAILTKETLCASIEDQFCVSIKMAFPDFPMMCLLAPVVPTPTTLLSTTGGLKAWSDSQDPLEGVFCRARYMQIEFVKPISAVGSKWHLFTTESGSREWT